MQDLSPVAVAAWTDLLRHLRDAAVAGLHGTPRLKQVGRKHYWYDHFRMGSQTVDRYIAEFERLLDEVAREVGRLGGEALVLPLDVADEAAVHGAADRIERELGPIDVWVNNAMVTVFGRVRDLEPEELRRVTEVTYLGSAFGIQAALRHMSGRDRGTVIQIGSALAYRSIPLQAAYCGAKAAISAWVSAS